MTACRDVFLWASEIDIRLCIHHEVGICERVKATINPITANRGLLDPVVVGSHKPRVKRIWFGIRT